MQKQREAVMCFLINGDNVLMINRNKSPFMGMWNVVGGKVEDGESPKQATIREVKEESGINIKEPILLSRFTWNYDDEIGYAYYCKISECEGFPLKTSEGIVDFKPISWVLNEKNYGVIEDLRVFLGDISRKEKHNYHLIYEKSKLIKVEIKD